MLPKRVEVAWQTVTSTSRLLALPGAPSAASIVGFAGAVLGAGIAATHWLVEVALTVTGRARYAYALVAVAILGVLVARLRAAWDGARRRARARAVLRDPRYERVNDLCAALESVNAELPAFNLDVGRGAVGAEQLRATCSRYYAVREGLAAVDRLLRDHGELGAYREP